MKADVTSYKTTEHFPHLRKRWLLLAAKGRTPSEGAAVVRCTATASMHNKEGHHLSYRRPQPAGCDFTFEQFIVYIYYLRTTPIWFKKFYWNTEVKIIEKINWGSEGQMPPHLTPSGIVGYNLCVFEMVVFYCRVKLKYHQLYEASIIMQVLVLPLIQMKLLFFYFNFEMR